MGCRGPAQPFACMLGVYGGYIERMSGCGWERGEQGGHRVVGEAQLGGENTGVPLKSEGDGVQRAGARICMYARGIRWMNRAGEWVQGGGWSSGEVEGGGGRGMPRRGKQKGVPHTREGGRGATGLAEGLHVCRLYRMDTRRG
jgi:hypothetical protein